MFFTFSMGFTQNHGLVASVRDSHGFSLWDHGWPRMTMYFPTIQGARAANSSRCWSHKNPKRSTRRTRRLSEMHWQNCKTSFPQKNVFHHWELPWYLLNMSQICLKQCWKGCWRLESAWSHQAAPVSESNFQASNMKQPQLQTIFNPDKLRGFMWRITPKKDVTGY